MPSSHNEPHLSLAPEPWHAAGRHVLTDGDEEPVDGVVAVSRMAVSADWLGTCSSTPRQHQGWCCRVPSSNACFLASRDPVLQLAGTNKGGSPSSSTGPASPRIAQQHVNSAVNTMAPCQATLVPRTGYSWEGEVDTQCVLWPVKTTENGRSSVVSLRKHAISTACHRGRCLSACLEAGDIQLERPRRGGRSILGASAQKGRDLSSNTSQERRRQLVDAIDVAHSPERDPGAHVVRRVQDMPRTETLLVKRRLANCCRELPPTVKAISSEWAPSERVYQRGFGSVTGVTKAFHHEPGVPEEPTVCPCLWEVYSQWSVSDGTVLGVHHLGTVVFTEILEKCQVEECSLEPYPIYLQHLPRLPNLRGPARTSALVNIESSLTIGSSFPPQPLHGISRRVGSAGR